MDNKKWYKRLSTCFWFVLATLPILISIFSYIFTSFVHTDSLTTTNDIVYIKTYFTFDKILVENTNFFAQLCPQFLRDCFNSLFTDLTISSQYKWVLISFCSWFVWVYFIELLIDFFVWLPKWCHNMLEKGVGKID